VATSPDAEIRLLLVEDMPQVAQYIRSLVDAQAKVKLLDVVTDGRIVIEQVRELGPDILIVDALMQGKINGMKAIIDIREAGIDMPIIALTVQDKPISVGEGMGNTKVLPMPFSGYDFMRLLQDTHAERRALAPEALSRVYSIYGAKGGIGTTTLAYNIAASIRANGYRVALIDGSLQFGDLRALLRIAPDAPSILQLPISKVQKADLAEVMYRDPSGVEILLAPPRIEMAEMVTPRDLEKLLSLMRRMYNVVVIDTACAVDDVLLAFLDASDEMIEVVGYESAALTQARAMAATLGAIGYPAAKLRYLVNRADSTGGMPRDAISRQMGRKPDFEVRSDGILVLEANNRGVPFVTLAPDAPISGDVARIGRALTESMSSLVKAKS
jgi:pilus assembly protein CpaE